MPDWDADSSTLRANLDRALRAALQEAASRVSPGVQMARKWHTLIMQGLDVPNPQYVGRFRGEPGLQNIGVRVGSNQGVQSAKVAAELAGFENTLKILLQELDSLVPSGQEPDADQTAAILDVCAWAHSEWVRIHPFANGNGRTARLWANHIAARYGLPPFVCLRPRPGLGYGQAGADAMQGNWRPTASVFRQLLDDFADQGSEGVDDPRAGHK